MAGSQNIEICTYNANGLNDFKKRKDTFDYLRNYAGNIIFLQECHWLSSQEHFIRNLWGAECIVAGNNKASCGVAILFKNNFEYKISDVIRDEEGRYIILSMECLGQKITIGNIYGPSSGDHPEFFDKIIEHVNMLDNDRIILGGDWNVTLNPSIDTNNRHVYRNRSRTVIKNFMDQFTLIDIYREMHTNVRKYTWRRFNSTQRSRLDYFLISDELTAIVDKADISPGYTSDHSLVYLTLKSANRKNHRPFWKFNNSLLRDPVYVNIVKETILKLKQQYCVPVYDHANIHLIPEEDLHLTINDQLFLDVLLMELRSKCISYSVYKKRETTGKEHRLMDEIKNYESNLTDNNILQLDKCKRELMHLRQQKIEGMIIRSRARWVGDGERNSKYFCNLEKRNYIDKAIHFLQKEDGTVLHDQDSITKEVQLFYKNLYSFKDNVYTDASIDNLQHPALSDEESQKLEGLITMNELTLAIKQCKNDKSPGSDGFTAEFIKFFFLDLKYFILRSLNFAFEKGEMSITQRQGIITCIPKEGKDKRLINNWRPITLLNIIYKLASSCIADRIKLALPMLIHENQQGFMKNRNIGENIRLIYDTLVYTKEKNIQGLLLSIDFYKAFDCVSWSFIQKALSKFNFGKDIKRWILTFYSNITSCVRVNGQYSEWFSPKRGTRQGDPLSPYLFLLCAELMAAMIRRNQKVKGIEIDVENEILLSQFADDTTIFLDGTQESFYACINTLKEFSLMSGLTINCEKSFVLWIGASAGCNVVFLPELKFKWNPATFKILGVTFSLKTSDIAKINYENKLKDIKKILSPWTKRNLTPFGKITVIKTLAMSKLTYLFLNIPDPTEEFLNDLQKLFFQFLWDNKNDKIKRTLTYQNYDNGGLKMVNVKAYLSALKITWLKRILSSDGKITKILYDLCPSVRVIKDRGGEFANCLMHKMPNSYWFDVFKHYKKMVDSCTPRTIEELLDECIHYNRNICIANKVFYNKNWIDNGIIYVGQLFAKDNFVSYTEFKAKFPNAKVHFIMFEGLIKSIKVYIKKLKLRLSDEIYQYILDKPLVWKCMGKGGARHMYNCLVTHDSKIKCIEKWSEKFNDNIDCCKLFRHIRKATTDTYLRWFQYRLIYRLIPTQRFLFLRKIVSSAKCTFCDDAEETIEHLFWDCSVTQKFWQDFMNWLNNNFDNCVNLNLSKRLIILGCSPKVFTDPVVDLFLLVAKNHLFHSKIKMIKPNIELYVNTIKQRYSVEKQIAFSHNAQEAFFTKWNTYVHYF